MWGIKRGHNLEIIAPTDIKRIENKIDYLIDRICNLTQAYDDLSAEVTKAVADIGALATLISAHVAGTPDAALVDLTTKLKTATDAVVAVLTPVVAPAV